MGEEQEERDQAQKYSYCYKLAYSGKNLGFSSHLGLALKLDYDKHWKHSEAQKQKIRHATHLNIA